jgi:hypothetical protein
MRDAIRKVVLVVLVGCVVLFVAELPRALASSGEFGIGFYALVYVLPALVIVIPGFLLMRGIGGSGRRVVWAVAAVAVAWWLGLVDPDLVQMVLRGEPVSFNPLTDPLVLLPTLLILAGLGGFATAISSPRPQPA